MTADKANVERNIEANIVIIGGGGAGLTAAIAAIKGGTKNVIILEKSPRPGGNARVSHGILAVNSRAQKRLGIELSADEIFKDKMAYSNWRLDPRIVRTVIDRSAEMINWLEDMGLRFDYIIQFIAEGEGPRTFHKFNDDPSQGIGERLVETLVRECRDLGVQLYCDTSAKKIRTDENGRVNGVLASTSHGDLDINAKSVIITTGGFGGSGQMLNKYFPSYGDISGISLPEMTGDGILMAEEVGAFIDNPVSINITGPGYHGSLGMGLLLFMRPEIILVNKYGERYVDESLRLHCPDSASTALCRQPDKICYGLSDTGIVQYLKEHRQPLCGLEKDMGRNGAWVDDLEESLLKGVEEGQIKKTDSWEEIARFIGADPDILLDTIERYNIFCDKGYDGDLLKDRKFLRSINQPPYYAVPGGQSFDTTMGGIRINHRAEVISRQDRPIMGLYAAGDTATGTETVSYNHKYPGSALCFAIVYGQVAGENAAKYVSREN